MKDLVKRESESRGIQRRHYRTYVTKRGMKRTLVNPRMAVVPMHRRQSVVPKRPVTSYIKIAPKQLPVKERSIGLLEPVFFDAQYMSAEEKRTVYRQWKNFLDKLANPGFDVNQEYTDKHGNQMPVLFQHFTEDLYHHLMQHCSFIAHYGRLGFYQHYFADEADWKNFFQQFDNDTGNLSFEYGRLGYWLDQPDYKDINHALVDAFQPMKNRIYMKANRGEIENLKRQKEIIEDRLKGLGA